MLNLFINMIDLNLSTVPLAEKSKSNITTSLVIKDNKKTYYVMFLILQ